MIEGASRARAAREIDFRRRVRDLISPEELRELSRPSAADTAFVLVGIWAGIVALLVLAHLSLSLAPGWTVLAAVPVVVLLATRVNALNVVIHEASHGFLAAKRSTNDLVANVGAAWWMLHSVEEYRPTHLLHHRHLNDPDDPDRPSYLLPAARGARLRLVLEDLLAITAAKRALTLLRGSTTTATPDAHRLRNLAGRAACQLVLLGQFVLLQGWIVGVVAYAVFWLVPTLCLFPLILRFKTVAEHYDAALRDPESAVWVARTSAADVLQNVVLGARMQYHFEHHVIPTVPFRGLAVVHERLAQRRFFAECTPEERDHVLSGGYVHFTRTLSRR